MDSPTPVERDAERIARLTVLKARVEMAREFLALTVAALREELRAHE